MRSCSGAQLRAFVGGTQLDNTCVVNMFVAGADLVRWEVTALTPDGPYRLTMYHPRGSIVEYFKDAATAMSRETELQALLTIVGTHGQSEPNATWIAMAGGVS